MQIHKFLATSALYLSLAGAGVATADESQALKQAVAGKAGSPVASVGSDKLRFTLRERGVLERYDDGRKGNERAGDDRDDRKGDRRRPGDHHDGKHQDGKHQDGKHKPLPPGLQKKLERGGELPPGWQNKLARGEVLPPDVYRAGKALPPEIRRQLPADPRGTVTLDIDGEVVRVIQDTREIVDILRGR